MEMVNGYYYKVANNTNAEEAKALIFKVFDEYQLDIDYPHAVLDIEENETAYVDGFLGLVFDPTDQLVGTFGLYKLSNKTAEIRKMYLLPEARGKGLGKWMVRFLLDKAKTLGYEIVELETSSSFTQAMGLYRKVGFRQKNAANITPACNRAFFMELV